jgi:hypothetical protein
MSLYGADPVAFESVSNVTATPNVALGTTRTFQGERYEYVYAIKECPVGYGTVYSGTSGHSVVATGCITGEVCAGWVKNATISSGSYGWLLKKGVVDAKNARASTAPSVNQPAYLGTDGGFVTDTSVATNAIDCGHVVGKVLSAGASGGTGSSLSLLLVSVY